MSSPHAAYWQETCSKASLFTLLQGIRPLSAFLCPLVIQNKISDIKLLHKVKRVWSDLKSQPDGHPTSQWDELRPKYSYWWNFSIVRALAQWDRSIPSADGLCLCLSSCSCCASLQTALLHQFILVCPPPSFLFKFLNPKSNWNHAVTFCTDHSVFRKSKLIFFAWEHPGSTPWPSAWSFMLRERQNVKAAFDCQCWQEIWAALY